MSRRRSSTRGTWGQCAARAATTSKSTTSESQSGIPSRQARPPTDFEIAPDGSIYVLEFCDAFVDPVNTRQDMFERSMHGGFKRFSGRLLRVQRPSGEVTVVAAGIIVLLLPLVPVLRRRPEDYGQLPDGVQRCSL